MVRCGCAQATSYPVRCSIDRKPLPSACSRGTVTGTCAATVKPVSSAAAITASNTRISMVEYTLTKSNPFRLVNRTKSAACPGSEKERVPGKSGGSPSITPHDVKMRGPNNSPRLIWSRACRMSGLPAGSRAVVTPNMTYCLKCWSRVRIRVSSRPSKAMPPKWLCESIRPGMRYLPVPSTTLAPGGRQPPPSGQRETMRPFSTTMVWSSSTTSDVIGMMSTPTIAVASAAGVSNAPRTTNTTPAAEPSRPAPTIIRRVLLIRVLFMAGRR